VRQGEAAHRAGHPGREVPGRRQAAIDLPLGVEIHRLRAGERRALAVVERGRPAVWGADDHEAAASDVAGARVRHGQGEGRRDGGVHGVAAAREDARARVRGQPGGRDDEPGGGGRALILDGAGHGGQRQDGERGGEQAERAAHHDW
jgi:hypothetical protein